MSRLLWGYFCICVWKYIFCYLATPPKFMCILLHKRYGRSRVVYACVDLSMPTTKVWPVWASPRTAARSSVPHLTRPSGGMLHCHAVCSQKNPSFNGWLYLFLFKNSVHEVNWKTNKQKTHKNSSVECYIISHDSQRFQTCMNVSLS